MEKKPLAVGIEDYRRMIDRPYYYVDKTLLIKELLDRGGYVNLFTRPRRFGKTLTLSMIKIFFECGADENGKTADNSRYFDGMLKAVKSFVQMEGKCREALLQIKEQGYTAELVEEGYKDILCFGICFCKKTCTVRTDSIE